MLGLSMSIKKKISLPRHFLQYSKEDIFNFWKSQETLTLCKSVLWIYISLHAMGLLLIVLGLLLAAPSYKQLEKGLKIHWFIYRAVWKRDSHFCLEYIIIFNSLSYLNC